MELKLITRLYDDAGNECKLGDTILIQSKNMDMAGKAIIQDIKTSYFTVIFDDRLIGYHSAKFRPSDILTCRKQD